MTNTTKIPKLRFKEFSWEWEEKKLWFISETYDSLHKTPKNYEKKGYSMIRVTDVNNHILNTKLCLKVSEDVFKEFTSKYKPTKWDIVLSRVWTCWANIKLLTYEDVCLGQNTVLLKPNINNDFFHLLIKSDSFQKLVNKKVVGSTQKTLSLKDLKRFDLLFPKNKDEQQKIASFLSSVDEKIENIRERKKALEEYKKWVMQKIFRQEIRFKGEDWEEFGEWEEVRLRELLKEFNKKTTENNQYQVLSSTNKWIFLQSEYFNDRQIASKDNIWYKILLQNQLVFSPQNLWMWNINLNLKFKIWIVSPSYKIFEVNKSKCLVSYINFIIKTNRMLYEYSQASEQWASVVRRNLDIENFKAIKIKVPSLKEQEKIANFLSNIDEKIEKISFELEESERFKKGLLQGMFI